LLRASYFVPTSAQSILHQAGQKSWQGLAERRRLKALFKIFGNCVFGSPAIYLKFEIVITLAKIA